MLLYCNIVPYLCRASHDSGIFRQHCMQAVPCAVITLVWWWGQVAKIVESLGGDFHIEHDTEEWSVDIGFLDHQLAIEVSLLLHPFCEHCSTISAHS